MLKWTAIIACISLVLYTIGALRIMFRCLFGRFPVAQRPFVCDTCGRDFPYVNQHTEPEPPPLVLSPERLLEWEDRVASQKLLLHTLAGDGLLALHVRYEHQGAPGYWHGKLPERRPGIVTRRPPAIWHGHHERLLTAAQWEAEADIIPLALWRRKAS